MINCKICNSESKYFANGIILSKYDIKYFKCTECSFVQTEEPYWLEEAYSNAIASADVGIVKRNLELSNVTKTLIDKYFDAKSEFIDYGAGYGLFVRLMRDKGYNFFWYDKFAQNLFSKNFESNESKPYQLLTAFEVFEHLLNPIDEINSMFLKGESIFFSTTLLPKSEPKPNEWWYYSLFAGQHISIYTLTSLQIIAETFNKKLISDGKSLHLFTNKEISSNIFKVMINKKISPIINLFSSKNSLINSDFEKITGVIKKKIK
ncbi:MAG: class I SAM-dependent methyltransferase [Melioribacteraceae bacterium]|nr:class I SAM-dependent methyltransferase [Melioribacteraceae bacterium]